MGMVLGFALFAGVFAGVLVSAALVMVAMWLTRRVSRSRPGAWRVFYPVALGAAILLILGIYHYPFETGTPGSNYGLLFGHFFRVGLAYAAVPGASAVLAFLAALFCPRADG